MNRRRLLLMFLLLLTCGTLCAQELEVFDASDFLDPRDRGAVFIPDKIFGVKEPGQAFTLTRVFVGRVLNDYQWRNTSKEADSNFVHLTTSFYRADHQFNAKLTLFRGDDDAQLSSYRGTLQYARYYVTADSVRLQQEPSELQKEAEGETVPQEDIRIAGRYVVTLSAEHNPYDENSNRKYLYEYGIDSSGYARYKDLRVVGSLVWTHRIVGPEKSIDRIAYYYRLGDRTYRDGLFRWNANVGFGAERNDGWHFGVTRVVLTGAIEIPVLNVGLNVAYAPTYVPGRKDRQTYHEVAVFLDRTAFARVGALFR